MFHNSDSYLKMVMKCLFFCRKSYMYWHKTIKNDDNETIICLWQNDQKNNFLFFCHFGQKQIFVFAWWSKRGISFVWSFGQKQIFFLWQMTKKGKSLPRSSCQKRISDFTTRPEKGISLFWPFAKIKHPFLVKWPKQRNPPPLAIRHKTNICSCMYFTDMFAFFFFVWHFALFP